MKKKPKIEIIPTEPITKIEKDIMIAGAVKGDPEILRKAAEDGWTFAFTSEVVEQLKDLGMTPEDLMKEISKDEEKPDN